MRASTILVGPDEAPEQPRSRSHERRLEQREADLERREMAVWSRENAVAVRVELIRAILVAARMRDDAADALDALADQRERDLDLAQLLSLASDSAYGADWPARRHAAISRACARADRVSSQEDLKALLGAYEELTP